MLLALKDLSWSALGASRSVSMICGRRSNGAHLAGRTKRPNPTLSIVPGLLGFSSALPRHKAIRGSRFQWPDPIWRIVTVLSINDGNRINDQNRGILSTRLILIASESARPRSRVTQKDEPFIEFIRSPKYLQIWHFNPTLQLQFPADGLEKHILTRIKMENREQNTPSK